MSNSLREQITSRMNLKETDELLDIWQSNDRFEWSDEAFDVISEILKNRGVDIPPQGEPVYEQVDVEADKDDYGFSEEELRILDDENPPAFYDPLEVLWLTRRLDWMVKATIYFSVAYSLLNFSTSKNIAQSYFLMNPNSAFVYLIAALIVVLNAVITIVITYVPLKALVRILRILMEMEFRSREST